MRSFRSALIQLCAFLATLLASALFFCSCASAPVTQPPSQVCNGIDWFEMGKLDGGMGETEARFLHHQQHCDGTTNPPDRELYFNGRNAGLEDYCTSENGREIGRSGGHYQQVCPDYLEVKFLASYQAGRRIHDLEEENAKIEQQLHVLRDPVNTANQLLRESDKIARIKELEQHHAQNTSLISNLERVE